MEFQPLFRGDAGGVNDDLLKLGGAAFLVPPFVFVAVAGSSRVRRAVALFAAVYLVAAVTSQRFLVPAIPLLAVAAAAVVADQAAAGRRLVAAACAALVLVPSALGCRRFFRRRRRSPWVARRPSAPRTG